MSSLCSPSLRVGFLLRVETLLTDLTWNIRQTLGRYTKLTLFLRFICLLFVCFFLFVDFVVTAKQYSTLETPKSAAGNLDYYGFVVCAVSSVITLTVAVALTVLLDTSEHVEFWNLHIRERLSTVALLFCYQSTAVGAMSLIFSSKIAVNLSGYCACLVLNVWIFLLCQLCTLERERQLAWFSANNNNGRLCGA